MRMLLIVFLMCLLPLRGWAATSMTVTMAAQQMAAAVQAGAMADMPDDCPMHLAASGPSADTDTPADASPHCNGCDTCELCLAMASFTPGLIHATPASLRTAPVAAPQGFINADRTNRLKPPIS